MVSGACSCGAHHPTTSVKYSRAVADARPGAERAVLIAVALGALLAPLNSTMIAVAVPDIVDDFDTTVGTVGMARHLVPSRPRRRPASRRQARRPARPPSVRARRACDLRSRIARRCAGSVARVPDRVPRAAGRLGRGRLPERRRSDPRARSGGSSRRSVRDRRRLDRAGRRPRAAHRRRARGGRRMAGHLPRQHPVRRCRARNRLASGAAASRRRRHDRVRLARSCTAGDRPDRVGAPRDRGWPRPGDARARVSRSCSCSPLVLIWWELRHPDPVFQPRFFAIRPFAAANAGISSSNLAFYTVLLAIPILLTRHLEWSSLQVGPRACTAVGPDDRVLADRGPPRRPLRPAPAVGRRVRRPHGRPAATRPRCPD